MVNMPSDNEETAAWAEVKNFSESDYNSLNPYDPEHLFMRMWAVNVCLWLFPIPKSYSRTYVRLWKPSWKPLPTADLSNEDLISLKQRFRGFFQGPKCERILQENQWVCRGIMKVFGALVVQITFVTATLALQGNNGAISACQHGLSDQATKLVKNLYSRLAADAEQVEMLRKVCDRALVETGTTALLEWASVDDMATSWYSQGSTLPQPSGVADESWIDVQRKARRAAMKFSIDCLSDRIAQSLAAYQRCDAVARGRMDVEVFSHGADSAVTSASEAAAAPQHLEVQDSSTWSWCLLTTHDLAESHVS